MINPLRPLVWAFIIFFSLAVYTFAVLGLKDCLQDVTYIWTHHDPPQHPLELHNRTDVMIYLDVRTADGELVALALAPDGIIVLPGKWVSDD